MKDDVKNKNYDVFGYTNSYLDDNEDGYYKRELPTFSQDTFYNLGRNIMVSLLDIWNKNPYSRSMDMNADRR